MKITLVKPFTESRKKIYTVHPLSLGYLAAALIKKNEVAILDCENLGYNDEDFKNYIQKENPDLVGITVFSHNKQSAARTVEIIRGTRPDTFIIAGGPHVNALGARIFGDLPLIDYAFVGEAEESFPLLVKLLEKKDEKAICSVPGLIFRDNEKVTVNKNVFENDISRYDPMPYDLLGIRDYFKGLPQGVFSRHRELVSIITSRGCPYPCTFCAASTNNGKKVRYRNVSNVIEEIEILMGKYGAREIHILDDNFTFLKKYAMSFCENLIRKNYGIDLALPNGIRLDRIDGELLAAMKKAGFYALSFGIESGSDETLRKINKHETTGFIRKQIGLAKKYGFRLTGTFIIGFPWETREDVNKTLQFAKSLPLDHAAFGNFTPLPGTEITENLIRAGELDEDFEVPFTWGDVTYSPKEIPPGVLKRLQRACIFNFYFPSRIYEILKSIRLSNILSLIKRVLLLFGS